MIQLLIYGEKLLIILDLRVVAIYSSHCKVLKVLQEILLQLLVHRRWLVFSALLIIISTYCITDIIIAPKEVTCVYLLGPYNILPIL